MQLQLAGFMHAMLMLALTENKRNMKNEFECEMYIPTMCIAIWHLECAISNLQF
jgi:hypothetical protein